jgi:hypothetical protein
MAVDLTLTNTLATALEPGRSMAFCRGTCEVAPRFREPFPVDRGRLTFNGSPVPCFGIWHGIPSEQRARLAAQVRLPRQRGPQDFVLELLPADDRRRIAIARTPEVVSLKEASDAVVRALRHGGGWTSRLLRRDRVGPYDGVRAPVVRAFVAERGTRVRIDVGSGGPELPVPDPIRLGRGDAYQRGVQCDGPFILWVGEPHSLDPQLVAWIARP